MKKCCIIFAIYVLLCFSVFGNSTMENTSVDYSADESWLILPENPTGFPVDVFYVYPTVYQGFGLQDINDSEQTAAAMVPLRTQASVFEESANIYAPLYRQIGKAEFANTETLNDYIRIAQKDVEDAFYYYLENHNKGKPFIIAAHSQGSSLLREILKEIWGKTGAEERMIATYIIGYSITESDILHNSNIRMSENPTDLGCFISYNSIADGAQSVSVQILEGALVTNPLSWKSSNEDSGYIPASENLGAVFFDENGFSPKLYPEFTSARIKGHGLVCEPADTSILSAYPEEGIYHPDDYSLFYQNIKDNIAVRIESYFSKVE